MRTDPGAAVEVVTVVKPTSEPQPSNRKMLPATREATTPPDTTLLWFLRSLGDHDTHRGHLRADGTVAARCGLSFTPRPTLRITGQPPGALVAGPLALRGNPPDPDQTCSECRGGVR
ncbi:MAG: hypothetical protein ACRDQJ_07450 [Pseudonocardiaceae bacterium]